MPRTIFFSATIKGMSDSLYKFVRPEGMRVSAAEAFWTGFARTADRRVQTGIYLRIRDIKAPKNEF